MRVVSAAHAFFAAIFIAMGVLGLVQGDFAPVWQPVSADLPGRELLVYVCAVVSLVAGVGLVLRGVVALACRVLFAYLLVWMLLFKVSVIFHAPAMEVSYESCAETAVLVAGAWVLYARLGSDWDRQRFAFASGVTGVRGARVLYGLALLAFGLSHFAYRNETASLVPAWLPGHMGWAYFTGAAYLAAGVAVLVGVYARAAAMLCTLQMALFSLLVWVPIVMVGADAPQWSELMVSWALTSGGWLVADSYR